MSLSLNSLMTAEQLEQLSQTGVRCELVAGELHTVSPAGFEHGFVAARILLLLGNHVRAKKLGKSFAAETGFLLSRDPDTVRAPDAAFVSNARLKDLPSNLKSYPPIAPDLVAEVVSPSDTFCEVEEKARYWIESGTSMVLVVDPSTQTLQVYQDEKHITVLREADNFDAGEVVPGWRFVVRELFE